MIRLLHLADVHLDRPFVGMDIDAARARRRELRTTFQRCLNLAVERQVDAITIGGDLWEHEHVTPDTLRWVAARLSATGVPVIVVAGNHDPLSPGGPYERTGFDAAVRVLPSGPVLVEHRLSSVSVWGTSWRSGVPLTASPLREFRAPADGRRHLLLLHGTCGAYFDGSRHCPFTGDQVREAGFDLCLAGHLHAAGTREEIVVYPGSPEPLAWSEDGRHTVAIVTIAEAGRPEVEYVDVNQRQYLDVSVPCDGLQSSADIERVAVECLDSLQADGELWLRVRLTGRVALGCDPDPAALAAAIRSDGATSVEVRDETAVAYDLESLSAGGGVTAVFVRDMVNRIEAEASDKAELELALELGLQALHGEVL